MEKEKYHNIRAYEPGDYRYLYESLISEGFAGNRMSFLTDFTFITDLGFFSWRYEHGVPRLVHFYVNKDKRSLFSAIRLVRIFKKTLNGLPYFIAEVPRENPMLEGFVKFVGGKEPFYEDNGDKFYMVKTNRR